MLVYIFMFMLCKQGLNSCILKYTSLIYAILYVTRAIKYSFFEKHFQIVE